MLTDLPYGTTQNKWDIPIDLAEFWDKANRILKPNGAAVMFSQMPFTADLVNSNRKQFRYEWIWKKRQGTGFLNAKKMPMKAHENILVFYRRLPTYHPQMRTGFKPEKRGASTHFSTNYREIKLTPWDGSSGERYPIDVIEFVQVNCSAEPKLHPTQKPVALLEYLIKTYTNGGETVLDCCMGSGSTGVACMNTGRKFIGMELDEHYYNVARERIEVAQQ